MTSLITWNLKNNINEQTKQKQNHRHREQTDGCQWGLEAWVEKVQGLGSTDWQLQNSHRAVKYSVGNTPIYVWYQVGTGNIRAGDHFVKCMIV